MNIRQLETLVAINDEQGFKRASAALNMTPSAVSMQMRSLEMELNVELFDRRSRPPILNAKGRELLQPVREILVLHESVMRLAAGSVKLAAEVELGVVQSATITLLPVARAVIADRYPGLKIKIVSGLSGELMNKVLSGALNAAVITQPRTIDRQLRCETLLEERMIIVCHKRQGKPSMKLLGNLPFIRFNRKNGIGRITELELNRRKIKVSEAMEADSVDSILTMVASGYGISVVPEYSILPHHQDTIACSLFGSPPVTRKLALILPRTDSMPIDSALHDGFSVAVSKLKAIRLR